MRIPHLIATLTVLVLSAAPAGAQGRWRVSYPEAQNPTFVALQQMFSEQDILASMVDPLNEHFPVSRDVTVELAECGREGAFYDADRPAVQLCYELLMTLAEQLMSGGENGDELFVGAFGFILLHQVGHAMIDLLELPVSAPPEEAADQLAVLMIAFAEGELYGAAQAATRLSAMNVDWENPGSGRAALRGARLQNLLCLLYGSDPEGYAWIADEAHIPSARAARCEEEYEQLEAEWLQMLSEHVQD